LFKQRALGEEDDNGISIVLENIPLKKLVDKPECNPFLIRLQEPRYILQVDVGGILNDPVLFIQFEIA
jgi:hypothetical protein